MMIMMIIDDDGTEVVDYLRYVLGGKLSMRTREENVVCMCFGVFDK